MGYFKRNLKKHFKKFLTKSLKYDFKGNMHHKYDISLKDAFYIIDLAAEIFFFENFES